MASCDDAMDGLGEVNKVKENSNNSGSNQSVLRMTITRKKMKEILKPDASEDDVALMSKVFILRIAKNNSDRAALCEVFSESYVTQLFQDRQTILHDWILTIHPLSRERLLNTLSAIEETLFEWMRRIVRRNNGISDKTLLIVAREIKKLYGLGDFRATPSWKQNFKETFKKFLTLSLPETYESTGYLSYDSIIFDIRDLIDPSVWETISEKLITANIRDKIGPMQFNRPIKDYKRQYAAIEYKTKMPSSQEDAPATAADANVIFQVKLEDPDNQESVHDPPAFEVIVKNESDHEDNFHGRVDCHHPPSPSPSPSTIETNLPDNSAHVINYAPDDISKKASMIKREWEDKSDEDTTVTTNSITLPKMDVQRNTHNSELESKRFCNVKNTSTVVSGTMEVTDDAKALNCVTLLQEFALLKDNYRAVGLLEQLERFFQKTMEDGS